MDDNRARNERIDRMHRLRDRIGEWAAKHRRQVLVDGIRCWIGHHEGEEQLARQGVAFALITPGADGQAPFEAFADAVGKLPRRDRVVLEAWRGTWFGIFEVAAVAPGHGFVLDDVMRDETLQVIERAASYQVRAGQWILAAISPYEQVLELEGTTQILGAAGGRIAAVQAWIAAATERGLDPAELDPAASRRIARAVVAAVRESERKPRFVNYEGDDVELITAVLELEWDTLVDAAREWEDVAWRDEEAFSLLGAHEPSLRGPVVKASLSREGQGVALFVNSRRRLEWALRLLEQRLEDTVEVSSEDVRQVESDPAGRELKMDTGALSDTDGEPSLHELREDYAWDWMDLPLPALDGLSPREAVDAGRHAEVRALLPGDLEPEVAQALKEDLGLE